MEAIQRDFEYELEEAREAREAGRPDPFADAPPSPPRDRNGAPRLAVGGGGHKWWKINKFSE